MPFRDIVGHRRLIGLLSRSVRRDSLPPSLIFAGPSGVGKQLAALATAQALNCTAPIEEPPSSSPENESVVMFDACGKCPTCRRIARGVHADVIVVTPGDSGSIKTEHVRDVIDRSGFRPFEGRRRVVIIDEADALVPPAQNALLKTLEEPPSSSMFVLVTARADSLLPTVRSRCPQLRFRHLDPDDVETVLRRRGLNAEEARAIAAAAEGSPGRALEMSANDLVETRTVAHQVLAEAAVSDDPRRRLETAKALAAPASKTGGTGTADRERLASHLRAMASLLRDVEVVAMGADARLVANADVRGSLDRLCGAYRGERGVRAFAAIDQALVALDRNAGVKIVADWVVLQL